MTSLHAAVCPLPLSRDQLHQRLKEISRKVNSNRSENSFKLPPGLEDGKIRDCVIGPKHIGLLFEDGSVCRAGYVLHTELLNEDNTSSSSGRSTDVRGTTSSAAESVVGPSRLATSSRNSSGNSLWPSSGVRGRVIRRSRGSYTRRSYLGPYRSVLPVNLIPEDLIEQVQNILQDKSPQAIARELQRSNLDVNVAVNNFLSRDDDDDNGEQDDGSEYGLADDLLSDNPSFLDDGAGVFMFESDFTDDSLGADIYIRPSTSRGGNYRQGLRHDASSTNERDEASRLLHSLGDRNDKTSSIPADATLSKTSDIVQFNHVQWWLAADGSKQKDFTHIAALYSELAAVNSFGKLCQWKWSEKHPYKDQTDENMKHPRTADLDLKNEVIIYVAANCIRASVATLSGKVATWVDESLRYFAGKIDHPARKFREFEDSPIASLHVSPLYTCVQLASGAVMWWGIPPYCVRKKTIERVKARSKKANISSESPAVSVGSMVRFSGNPIYNHGALAFNISSGKPKIGQLLESIWNMDGKRRFKLLPYNLSAADLNDNISKPQFKSSSKRYRDTTDFVEESWDLKNVVFVESSMEEPVGQVVKIDGGYAVVNVSSSQTGSESETGVSTQTYLETMLRSCRLLQIEDLQVVKIPYSSKCIDKIQRVPKLLLPYKGRIVALTANCDGILQVIRQDSKLTYVRFNLESGRGHTLCSIPTDMIQVEEHKEKATLLSIDQESNCVLRDSLGALFPLSAAVGQNSKDSDWLNLPPTRSIAVGINHFNRSVDMRNTSIALIAMVMDNQKLMSYILESDYRSMKQLLDEVDRISDPESKQNYIKSLLLEHCDGKRNILHMCASMCRATVEEDKRQAAQSTSTSPPPYSTPYLLANLHRSTSLPTTCHSYSEGVDRLIASSRMSGLDEDIYERSRYANMSSHQEDFASLLGLKSNNDSAASPGPSGRESIKVQSTAHAANYSRREQENLATTSSFEKETGNSASIKCLMSICKNEALKPYLGLLLLTRDAQGYTPFMLAVHLRAYRAALILFELAKELAEKQEDNKEVLRQIICPSETTTDCSPIYVLCLNDCCSYTWTGEEHINQDVYECRTCGLVDSHCCCSECALICHKGHNCVPKSSPSSAYCDCLKKCKCQIQVAGNQADRLKLLHKLIAETDLVRLPNDRGEHILLFVLQTAVRQASSQNQFRSQSHDRRLRSSKSLRSLSSTVTTKDVNTLLDPPKFAPKALEILLQDWTSVMSLIMPEAVNVIFEDRTINRGQHFGADYTILSREEQKAFLSNQDNSVRLDCFSYYLIVKYNSNECKALEYLLSTIVTAIENPVTTVEGKLVADRFVRSVARIFVVLSAAPDTSKVFSASLRRCRTVFQSLHVFAVTELAKSADSLMAPVRLGIAQPAWLSILTGHIDAAQFIESLFITEPFTESTATRTHTNNSKNATSSEDINQSAVHASQELNRAVEHTQSDTFDTEGRSEGEATSRTDNDIALPQAPIIPGEIVDSDSETSNPLEQSESVPETHGDELHSQGVRVDDNSSNNESEVDLGILEEIDSDSSDSIDQQNERTDSSTTRLHLQSDIESSMVFYTDEDDDTSSSETFEDPEDILERPQSRRMGRNYAETHLRNVSRSFREPHVLQWAVNSTIQQQQTGSHHVIPQNSVIYGESIRTSSSSNSNNTNREVVSALSHSSSSCLARMFATIVREITELLVTMATLKTVKYSKRLITRKSLKVDNVNLSDLQEEVKGCLSQSWRWIMDVMDNTESQLRFGVALLLATDEKHPLHPLNPDYQQRLLSTGRRDRSSNRDAIHLWESGYRRAKLETNNFLASSRHDVLIYALSLMRSYNYEHRDTVPFMDISALKHAGYVFDAFMYFLRNDVRTLSPDDEMYACSNVYDLNDRQSASGVAVSDKEISDYVKLGNKRVRKNKRFFRRTSSTLCLGAEPADPMKTSVQIALPLAEKPHLLSPSVRKDDLFSSNVDNRGYIGSNRNVSVDLNLATRLQNRRSDSGSDFMEIKPECWLGRWKLAIELFSRVFMEDVGSQPGSVLTELVSFDIKEARFRREMEKLKNLQTRDLVIEVEREPGAMIKSAISILNDFYKKHSSSEQPLAVHRVKVTFKNEPGEGSGVARSFYSAIAEAFLSTEDLPEFATESTSTRGTDGNLGTDRKRNMNYFAANPRTRDQQTRPLSYDAAPFDPTEYIQFENMLYSPTDKQVIGKRLFEKVKVTHPQYASKITGMLLELSRTPSLLGLLSDDDYFYQRVEEAINLINMHESESEGHLNPRNSKDKEPLFYQPGKIGFYSPRSNSNNSTRLNVFRNVGRIVGLCLLQNEVCTLTFNRHVLKVLLNRDLQWHDLAFFNSPLYENLRQLLVAANDDNAEQYFKELDLRFVIDLSKEEGGNEVELIEGGFKVAVTPGNVYEYVELYAMQKMHYCMEKQLEAMRQGVFDVIPSGSLKNLNAEDLRLLLNGTGEINVKWLKQHTSFNDESKGSSSHVERMQRWFWSIFEKMNMEERRELIYFWTSSPALPVSGKGFQPMPTITIRPPDDQHLPTANTCISRLYLPLYSSKAVLRTKLLMAIKIKVFGFV